MNGQGTGELKLVQLSYQREALVGRCMPGRNHKGLGDNQVLPRPLGPRGHQLCHCGEPKEEVLSFPFE